MTSEGLGDVWRWLCRHVCRKWEAEWLCQECTDMRSEDPNWCGWKFILVTVVFSCIRHCILVTAIIWEVPPHQRLCRGWYKATVLKEAGIEETIHPHYCRLENGTYDHGSRCQWYLSLLRDSRGCQHHQSCRGTTGTGGQEGEPASLPAVAGYTSWCIFAVQRYCVITITSVPTGRNENVFGPQGCYWCTYHVGERKSPVDAGFAIEPQSARCTSTSLSNWNIQRSKTIIFSAWQWTANPLTIWRSFITIAYTEDTASTIRTRRNEGVTITYVNKIDAKVTTSGLCEV